MKEKVAHRDALPSGTRLWEFELHEVLGRGGFGVTYLGRDSNLGINVAIKEYMPLEFAVREPDGNVYPKTHDTEEWYRWGLDRFLDEAKMLARFNHPSIVRVLRFFEGRGTAYIVMEYLEGQTLYALYQKETTLSEDRLRTLLTPILAGLEQVHDAGYLHRDIKPGNIVLGNEGTPVLIDFGAAQALTAEYSRTVASFEMPGFSPIEQYSSSRQHYGPWTDLYAVGAVLYRGMSGSVPQDALSRIEQDALQPVGRVARRRYSPQLAAAVDWALKLRAAERPRSIEQWRQALDQRDSLPVRRAPEALRGGGRRQAPEQRDLLPKSDDESSARFPRKTFAALAMVTMMLVTGGAWWWIKRPAPVPPADPPVDLSIDQKIDRRIAEVRNLIEHEHFADARIRLDEARSLGLDPELYTVFLAHLDKAKAGAGAEQERGPESPGHEPQAPPEPGEVDVAQLLSECRALKSTRRWEEALECVRRVRALGADDVDLRDEERELDMLVAFSRVYESPSVEGYLAFIGDYAWSSFVDAAREQIRGLEDVYWSEVKAAGTHQRYERYLEIYPQGRYADEAQRRLSGGGSGR